MRLDNKHLLSIFKKANTDNSAYIDRKELRNSKESLTEKEHSLLNEAYNSQKLYGQDDNGLTLTEYMLMMNSYRQALGITSVFNQEDISDSIKETNLKRIIRDPTIYFELDEIFRNDIDIIKAAIMSSSGRIFEDLKDIHKANPAIVKAAVNADIDNIKYVDKSVKEIQEIEEQINYYKNKLSKEYNINNFDRIKEFKVLVEIYNNRKNVKKIDDRPVALIAYSKDKERIFARNNICELINKGYKVVYFEIGTEDDLYRAIKETGKEKKIDFLEIGGHGWFFETKLSTPEGKKRFASEKYFLDRGDAEDFEKHQLEKCLADNSKIFLRSCSVNQENTNNLALVLKDYFANSKIFAPSVDVYSFGFKFVYDENNKIEDIKYINDSIGLKKE